MAINRASIAKELLPGLNAVFGLEYGEVATAGAPCDVRVEERLVDHDVSLRAISWPVKGMPS